MSASAASRSISPRHQHLACRLAVVEDDHHLQEDLRAYFEWRGAEVSCFDSAEAFWVGFSTAAPPHLVLLDIGLPGRSGLELAGELRKRATDVGIVLLTAFGTDTDRIGGLENGADAYLVKGASLELVEATCKSVLRRLEPLAGSGQTWELDPLGARLLAPDGGFAVLTHAEMIFLSLLMANPGAAVPRREMLTRLGKRDDEIQWRNLDGCAARLRRKVARDTGLELPVRSHYGHGYVFVAQAIVHGAE